MDGWIGAAKQSWFGARQPTYLGHRRQQARLDALAEPGTVGADARASVGNDPGSRNDGLHEAPGVEEGFDGAQPRCGDLQRWEDEALGDEATRFGEVGVPIGEERVPSAVLRVELEGQARIFCRDKLRATTLTSSRTRQNSQI